MAKKTSKKKTAKPSASKRTTKKATGARSPATPAGAKKSIKPSRAATTKKAGGRTARASGRKVVKKAGGRDSMVYYFGQTRNDGCVSMRELLGGKGANLAEMTAIGLPVPPGFTITTDTCARYHDAGKRLPTGLMNEVHANVAVLEKELGENFGDDENPLLVSVRSGAAASMPGMMDTILNLGLTDASVEGLAKRSGSRRFAYDAYRRLINMFGDVVMGIRHDLFENIFSKIKQKHRVHSDTDVPEEGLVELCHEYKELFRRHVGQEFPQNPFKQLELAIEAVFKSWNSERAVSYRRLASIHGLNGTGVNVQAMVYGNMGDDSGTGVAFTRNPSTGENKFYGEFLINAQGEDVVAGIRTPKPVAEMKAWDKKSHDQLHKIKTTLEKHYKDAQDIEFTIERGTLYMLQTRAAKRTGPAAVRIACDMVREKLIDEKQALLRIPAGDLTQLLLPSFDPTKKQIAEVLCKGLPASPGAAVGCPAFTAEEAVERTQQGESVILVRNETSPEDVEGMHSAAGILTATGGMTSHAAVVARGWGTCCVAGAGELHIDADKGTFEIHGRTFSRTDVISIDGSTGEVIAGSVPTVEPELGGNFAKVMKWADKYRRLGVRANADTPEDAAKARAFGAEGIGLARTEHMFFDPERIMVMREMIIADTPDARAHALEQLLPYQRDDFYSLFKAMKGLPVTIRLLDPPLHEFLPHDEPTQRTVAKDLGVPFQTVHDRVIELHELNPMLGHRGCRLAVSYPEILRMQVRAVVEASIECARDKIRAYPEIMIPLIGIAGELAYLRGICEDEIRLVRSEHNHAGKLPIKIGTMIEVPRAAVVAGELAAHADFFSFGTNDLTQLTFGYSRDDINDFLPGYLAHDILPTDPFQTVDDNGVGQLVEMGVHRGRAANENLKVGVCGEHGGDPASVDFFHRVGQAHKPGPKPGQTGNPQTGLDYVSCSPFRVPIARLAAAQAAIRHG